MRFINLNKIIFILSLLVFIANILLVYPIIKLVTFLPFFFGILSLFLVPKKIIAGPGLSIALLVMIFRYVMGPYFLSISSFSFISNEIEGATLSIMILEMLVILIVIRKFAKETNENNKFIINKFSYLLPIVFMLISILWSIKDPIPISRYNFILSGADELVKTDLTESEKGLPRLLNYTHYLLIISLFYFFYKFYVRKNNSIYFIIGFISVLTLGSFYIDSSRNSMLIPILAILFISIKGYPKFAKKIFISISLILVLSMSLLSVMKFYNSNSFEREFVNIETAASYLNSYFGGYYEVYLALEYSDAIKAKVDEKTFFNEVFAATPFFNRFVNLENRTTEFYNQTAYQNSHIIPTIGQGYVYLGFFLSWLFSLFVFRLIFLFDNLYFKTYRVDFAFLFAFIAIRFGWLHPGSLAHVFSTLNTFIVLYVIIYTSSYIGKKFIK
jgi:hypothetical protein